MCWVFCGSGLGFVWFWRCVWIVDLCCVECVWWFFFFSWYWIWFVCWVSVLVSLGLVGVIVLCFVGIMFCLCVGWLGGVVFWYGGLRLLVYWFWWMCCVCCCWIGLGIFLCSVGKCCCGGFYFVIDVCRLFWWLVWYVIWRYGGISGLDEFCCRNVVLVFLVVGLDWIWSVYCVVFFWLVLGLDGIGVDILLVLVSVFVF